MKKALVVATLGAAAFAAQAQSISTGATTGVNGTGVAFTGTSVDAFAGHTVTITAGAGGNSVSVTKNSLAPGVSLSSMSTSLSIGSTLGGGVGGAGSTAGSTAGLTGALPPGF